MDTANTEGLSDGLRAAIAEHIAADHWVPGCHVEPWQNEMIDHFGSSTPSGYMSEEHGWLLDAADVAAISE